MHYSTNRVNHDFQIAYFIAGSCHTPDAAFAILCDLKEDRNNSIKVFAASKLREQAKRIKAQRLLNSTDECDQLEGQADIVEADAMSETVAKNLAAAIAELATIQKYMDALESLRKYAHLPLPEAHEAAQQEEWKLELIHRAENSLLTTGSISPDQFVTMRMHPEFKIAILPTIERIQLLQHIMRLGNDDSPKAAMEMHTLTTTRPFKLAEVLGLSYEPTPPTAIIQ